MQGAMLLAGGIAAVIILVLVSSPRTWTQGGNRPQQQWGAGQGPAQGTNRPQSWGSDQRPPQQRSQGQSFGPSGNVDRRGGGNLLQLFAILGVLVIVGACTILILALQAGL